MTKEVRRKVWAQNGRSTYHKPQQVAELVVNMQRDGVLDGHTWQSLVWRDRVKSQLQQKDRLESLETDNEVNRVQEARNILTRSFIRVRRLCDCGGGVSG
jgi:hypothetical protein